MHGHLNLTFLESYTVPLLNWYLKLLLSRLFHFHTCCCCDQFKFKDKVNVVNLRWCLDVVEWRKTGYSVMYVCISLYSCSLGRSIYRETVYNLNSGRSQPLDLNHSSRSKSSHVLQPDDDHLESKHVRCKFTINIFVLTVCTSK